MERSRAATGHRPAMHPASVRLRRVMVLNAEMEYLMRRHLGVNDTDFDAMNHLLQHRSMSPGELARALHITTAATTAVVDRLVRAGHVRRAPHPKDRRRLIVVPTESSTNQAMGLLMPMILEADRLVRDMDPDEQDAVLAYLDGVTAAIERRLAALAQAVDQPPGKSADPPPAVQPGRRKATIPPAPPEGTP